MSSIQSQAEDSAGPMEEAIVYDCLEDTRWRRHTFSVRDYFKDGRQGLTI